MIRPYKCVIITNAQPTEQMDARGVEVDNHFGSIARKQLIIPIKHRPSSEYLAYHRDGFLEMSQRLAFVCHRTLHNIV